MINKIIKSLLHRVFLLHGTELLQVAFIKDTEATTHSINYDRGTKQQSFISTRVMSEVDFVSGVDTV